MYLQVYKLYNTSRLDFHVFYCSNVAAELQKQLPADEAKDLKLVRSKPPPSPRGVFSWQLPLRFDWPGLARSRRAW